MSTWNHKVTWAEGLFLRPQLFQQQERYLESFAHKRSLPLSPFYWGFSRLLVDSEALLQGKLVVSDAKGIYSDGTPFDIPNLTPPPTPLTIKPEHLGQTIHLALAIRVPNTEETVFTEAAGSTARYNVFDADVLDSNSVGQGIKNIQLSRLRLVLVPEKELGGAWLGMPVAKISAINSDGSIGLEKNTIPPINRYAASHHLSAWLNDLHSATQLRANELSSRLSGNQGKGATQAAEVSDFLLLQILNRYEPLLEHILQVADTPPEPIYTLLRSMSGELATFVNIQTRRPSVVPKYQHDTPFETFNQLVINTRAQLNSLLVRSAERITLETRQHGLYSAGMPPSVLQSFTTLVVAVHASVPADQLAQEFAAQSKIASIDRLPELVRLHLPGIALRLLPVPPRQIPFNAGYVYFQVDAQGQHWDHMLSNGNVGLHVAKNFPDLKMEVWGIR
jgi:type VI secretion system protein ImpJ